MNKMFVCNASYASKCILPDNYSIKNNFSRRETIKKETKTANLFDLFIVDHENQTGKRIYDRASLDELYNVFDLSEIIVKITNGGHCHCGWLHDISTGGAAVRVAPFSAKSVDFHLTFFLGTRFINAQAKVRNVSKRGGAHIIGFMFVDIANDCMEYLYGSIYITKLLHENSML